MKSVQQRDRDQLDHVTNSTFVSGLELTHVSPKTTPGYFHYQQLALRANHESAAANSQLTAAMFGPVLMPSPIRQDEHSRRHGQRKKPHVVAAFHAGLD